MDGAVAHCVVRAYRYSIVYMLTKMVMTRGVSVMLYVGYMLIASYAFFLFTGTVGFFACFTFVRIIYGAVKVRASQACKACL